MFRFIEFQEYTGQVNLVLSREDLQPLRLFFECIELAEDSYLGIQNNLLGNLEEELRVATKEESLHGSMASEIKAYRKPLKTSVEFTHNLSKARERGWRKELIKQLLDPTRVLHKKLQALCSSSSEHKSIQRRLNSLSGHSIYFEIFSTQALLTLSELSPRVEDLLNHLQKLKNKLEIRFKQNKHPNCKLGIKYLEELEISLRSFRQNLVENLLDRLESAHKQQDLCYSDNLHELVQAMNTVLNEADKIKFSEKARADFKPEHFNSAQEFIFLNGSLDQKRRLSSLSWHSPNHSYGKLLGHHHDAVSIAPLEIIPWISMDFNWFYYLFSPAYHYCRNFMKNYGYLIAEQKLLAESKIKIIENDFNLNDQKDLSYWRHLELKINNSLLQLESEARRESNSFFKSTAKLRLIDNYIRNLKKSLTLIYTKKIEILSFHAERLRTYAYFPELSQYSTMNIPSIYQKRAIKTQLFDLYQEILVAIDPLEDTESRALKAKLRFIKFIFDKFYNPDATTEESKPFDRCSILELEELSNTPVENLFEMSLTKLKLQLERYCDGYKIHLLGSDALNRTIIEKSFYQFIHNYLQFLNENSDTLKDFEEKIKLIEDTFLKINPIVTDFISDLQALRRNPDLKYVHSQIKLQAELLMHAILPQISKRSLGFTGSITIAEAKPTETSTVRASLSPSTLGAK